MGWATSSRASTADGPVELTVAGIVERSFPGRVRRDRDRRAGRTPRRASASRAPTPTPSATSPRSGRRVPAVAQLAAALALTVAPISQVEGAVGDALDRVFGLLDLLALAAVVVAGLGIVNTLSMDTWERVRELGVLRAAGMSRRQVWRSVLVEAGILGLIGAIVGSVAGIGVGRRCSSRSPAGRSTAGLVVPWATIALSLVLGVALAMLAAAQPARIAGRRSIVAAVRGE